MFTGPDEMGSANRSAFGELSLPSALVKRKYSDHRLGGYNKDLHYPQA